MTADRSVLVRLRANVNDYVRGIASARAVTGGFVRDLDTADSRMANIVQTALALGPALVPMGAGGVTAIAGLTNQLAFAAAGAGVTALAFNGVGDALKALREHQANPTEQSLEKLRETMENLGPAAQHFVRFLDDIGPKLQRIREDAQEGLLPGAQEGLEEFLKLTPQVRRIVSEIASTTGDLLADAGDNLNDRRWREFFRFLENEARPTLTTLGQTVGNLVEGLANAWMDFDPLNDMFAGGFLDWSRDFAEATRNLDDNEGFQEFLEYVERVGPKAAETFESLVDATAALVAAAAPVGEATLPIIRSLAEVLEAVAESPAGPVLVAAAAGLSAISRAVALFNAANGSAMASLLGVGTKKGDSGLAQINARVNALKAAAAAAGVLTVALTDVDEGMGLSNTATLALLGTLAGPWGAALGGAIGLTQDFAAANESVDDALRRADEALGGSTRSMRESLAGLKAELADLADTDNFSFGDHLETVFGFFAGKDKDIAERIHLLEEGLRSAKLATGDVTDLLLGDLHEGLGSTATGFDNATESAREFREELQHVDALLSKRAGLRDYQAALDEFRQTLKDNGQTLDRNTEKGRNVEAALDAIATTSLSAAEQLKGLNRIDFLQNAREDFIKAAMAAGKTREGAKALADDLGLLDQTTAKPKIELQGTEATNTKVRGVKKNLDVVADDYWSKILVDNDQALSGISSVKSGLASIQDKTVRITIQRAATRVDDLIGPFGNNAQGTNHWRGGTTWVGEDGPELVNLPRGSKVYSSPTSRQMAGGFGIVPASREVEEFARAVEDGTDKVRKHGEQVDRNREKLRDQLSQMRDERRSFQGTVAGTFEHEVFGNGLEGAFLQLEADANDARKMKRALHDAKKLGLSGPAFKALAESGDLQTAQELDTRKEVRRFEQLFAARRSATGTLATFAGEAAFGNGIRDLRDTVHRLDRTVKNLGKDVEKGAEKGAERGTHRGTSENGRGAYLRTGRS